MVIVVPSFNNIKWFELNLNSILNQKYENRRIIYIDDGSTDGTGEAVRNFLEEKQVDYIDIIFDENLFSTIPAKTQAFQDLVNAESHDFILVRNQFRCGALENLYRAIYSCHPQEIIVTVDGDDWLSDHRCLQRVNTAYRSNEVWLTHGRLLEYPWHHATWCEPVPPSIIEKNAFRTFKCPSHLRTFYAWLFKKIKLDDLLYEGRFFPMTWDMAMMYPMIEMAGERHAYLSEVNYVYNMANQINDCRVDARLQNDLDRLIRSKPPYQRLKQGD